MKKLYLAIAAAFIAIASPALAQQQTVKICVPTSGTACPAVTASAPLPVSGTFSATLSGFTPNGNYGTLTATAASSASTAMPAGTVVAFQNASTVDVSCVLSAGAATATTNKIIVRGGATVFLTVGSNVNAACINQTGSASNVIVMAGGAGLGSNFGGGGAGGGGGGAVTMASGAVASGAYSSGSIASGAFASGSIGAGAFASGAVPSGAYASGSLASGAVVDITNLSTPITPATATATKGILLGGQYNSTQATFTNGQQGSVQLSARGAIMVNPGAEAFNVANAGTFAVQAAQSGTWNITNISGTVSLPTGAATAANQTAAVAAKGEGATGAAVPSGAQYLGINIGGNLTGVTGLATGATVKAATVAIVDASGNQITTFGGAGGTASNFGSAFPSAGTAIGFSDGTNMVAGRVTAWGTTPTGLNSIAVNANVLASVLPSGAATAANQTTANTSLSNIETIAASPVPCLNATTSTTNSYTTGATNPANCDLNGNLYVNAKIAAGQSIAATQSGTWTVQPGNTANTTAWLVTGTGGTFPSTQSGTWTVQPGNTANTTPWLTTPSAGSTSGATPHFVVAANSNNSTNVKASAGTVYSIQTSNISASTAYFIKLYDKATAPTCGTDTPVSGYVIPPSNGGNNATIAVGKKFTLGIGYCVVAGIANNDNTSVPAATILVNVDYN